MLIPQLSAPNQFDIVQLSIPNRYKLQVLSIHNRLIKYRIIGFLFHLQIQKPGLLSTPRAPHSTFHLSHGSLEFLTGDWISCESYKKTWLLRNSFHGFPVDSPKQTNTQIYPENSDVCKWQWWSTWRFWDCTMGKIHHGNHQKRNPRGPACELRPRRSIRPQATIIRFAKSWLGIKMYNAYTLCINYIYIYITIIYI